MRKRKVIALYLGLAMLIGFFAGCDRPAANVTEPINDTKEVKGKKEDMFLAEGLNQEYISGQKEFAFRLFQKMKDDENIFLSPYSISTALSMLYNGADGNTRKEMAELFGYQFLPGYSEENTSEGNQQMNAYNKLLIDTLRDADPKVKIDIANSIWMAKDEQLADSIEDALLAPVRNYYNGDIFQVDFTNEEVLKQVNHWVSDQTDGMINPFLQQFASPDDLRLLLVNAIYFNGKWSKPFSPDDTYHTTFYGLNADTQVEEMCLYEQEYRYYADNGIQGLEIPYGNGELVMDVLIPLDKEQATIGEAFDQLKTEDINELLQKLDKAYPVMISKIGLPKFEMEYGSVELRDILMDLGMKEAFDDNRADFSPIGDNLVLTSVIHKAKIEVEEWGTRASAATGLTVETTAALVTDPLEFVVDVPFIFFIRDKATDTILFMGQMNHM